MKAFTYSLFTVAVIAAGYFIFFNDTQIASVSSQTAQVSGSGSGLLLHYTFDDGTATDASGGGRNGSITGATQTSGKIGGALSFDGNDSVLTPDSASVTKGRGFTMAAWIKLSALDTTLRRVIAKDGAYFMNVRNNGGIQAVMGGQFLSADRALPANEWHHFVGIVSDDGVASIYLDGVKQKATASNVTVAETTNPVRIGNNLPTGTSGFYGAIDDVRIYNRALSTAEVESLYTMGGDAVVIPPPTTTPTQTTTNTTTNTQTQTQTPTSTVTPNANGEYDVKQAGGGHFTTIQACADVAKAGETCLVHPGTYNERVETKKSGTASNRITFKANGAVKVYGFSVKNSYITIDGFEITNGPQVGFNAAIQMSAQGHHVHILNNNIHDTVKSMPGIGFYINGDKAEDSAGNAIIRGNVIHNTGLHNINLVGYNHLVEENKFSKPCGDAFRVFGKGHIIRKNILTNIDMNDDNKCGHVDMFQTFGTGNDEAYDMLIENNFMLNSTGQIAQLESDGNPNIHSWTFKNNVIANVFGPIQGLLPKLTAENNTFYKTTQSTAHPVGVHTDAQNNGPLASDGRVVNNAFVATGPDLTAMKGWYSVSNDAKPTFTASHNFITGFPPTYPKKNTNCPALYQAFDFCEPYGINGGDPMFTNSDDPIGPDGKIFTADDGLIPQNGSPLCGTGLNGASRGAYICTGGSYTPIANPIGMKSSTQTSTQTPTQQPTQQPQTQTPTVSDDDADGVANTTDLCPGTPSTLKNLVNTYGCAKPKITTFDITPNLNLDLRSISNFEVGKTNVGKILFNQDVSLTRDNTYIDLDTHLKIEQNKVSFNPLLVPELNKPATITLYNITEKNPKILKDGVECTTCTITSFQNGTLTFTIPGF